MFCGVGEGVLNIITFVVNGGINCRSVNVSMAFIGIAVMVVVNIPVIAYFISDFTFNTYLKIVIFDIGVPLAVPMP